MMTPVRSVPFGRPWITDDERKAVLAVLDGPILTHGPRCEEFETEFGAFLGPDAHCVSVSSCMAALHLACLQLGLGPGDEVIVPAQTHAATVHAVEWVGAKPRFVDCDPATGNMTADLIAAAVTLRTKAIAVVHFVGIPCDMPAIMAVAERHNLKVIEDCALAVGARWEGTHVGLFGDVGCFSFYPVKHVTTAEGGMFVTRHREVAYAASRLRAFGVDRHHGQRTIPGIYDIVTLGLNYRMSEIQAALGCQQLTRLAQALDMRRANFARLKARLSACKDVAILDVTNPSAVSSHYCLVVALGGRLRNHRNLLVTKLNQAGIGTSVYYPHPVPRLTYYRTKYGYEDGAYPNASTLSDCSFALPVGPHVTPSDIDYIACWFEVVTKELSG